ncbi:MAG: GNAT family N-acetyltransferase [Erythrobacter sp.]
MGDAIIETERLILRTERPGDFEEWMERINTPEVREYLGGIESADKVRSIFDRTAASEASEGYSFRFVEERDTGRLIGSCGLKRADAEGLASDLRGVLEIGWLLSEDAWGHGYATEAARAMLAHAFERLGTDLVIALTSRSNPQSWRIMEKLGMSYRPEYDFDDADFPPRDNPTIVYAITKQEWENAR